MVDRRKTGNENIGNTMPNTGYYGNVEGVSMARPSSGMQVPAEENLSTLIQDCLRTSNYIMNNVRNIHGSLFGPILECVDEPKIPSGAVEVLRHNLNLLREIEQLVVEIQRRTMYEA